MANQYKSVHHLLDIVIYIPSDPFGQVLGSEWFASIPMNILRIKVCIITLIDLTFAIISNPLTYSIFSHFTMAYEHPYWERWYSWELLADY